MRRRCRRCRCPTATASSRMTGRTRAPCAACRIASSGRPDMNTRALAAAVVGAFVLACASANGADKKVIRLWQTETEPQTLAVLNQMAADYEKTHPDVSIKIEGLAWGDLEKKLT